MKKCLSQSNLKIIACLTMLLDHIGLLLVRQPYWLMAGLRIVGRVAFPIYCLLITEGVSHTKSPLKYLLRLAVLMILSEPVFDLMCFGRFSFAGQSVMVTLLLGAGMCVLMEKLPHYWMKIPVVIPFFFLAKFAHCDYGSGGILMIAMFMLTRDLPWRDLFRVLLFGLLCIYMGTWAVRLPWRSVPVQWFAVAALVPILLYNGQKGSKNKALNLGMNLFYPVHMAVIVAIKLFSL